MTEIYSMGSAFGRRGKDGMQGTMSGFCFVAFMEDTCALTQQLGEFLSDRDMIREGRRRCCRWHPLCSCQSTILSMPHVSPVTCWLIC